MIRFNKSIRFKSIRFAGWALAASLAFITPAHASSSRSLACQHWRAIAGGDLNAVMADYHPSAALSWKNGGLKGDYQGTAAIQSAWEQFLKTRSPLTVDVQNIRETVSGNDRTVVTAEVTFHNTEWTYPLAYRLVFENGKIAAETWRLEDYDATPAPI